MVGFNGQPGMPYAGRERGAFTRQGRSPGRARVMAKRVAIAGGGLAGLACAKSLVDAGLEVSLFEGLPFLGGRASTYRDGDGDWVEQGLHIFLGTYSAFKTLLDEIGRPPDEVLFWMDEIRVQYPNGPEAVYGIN